MITNINIGKYGRLGNQLYQYASAFSLSQELGTDLLIPSESENYNTLGRFNPSTNLHDYYSNDLFKLFNLEFCQKKPLSYIHSCIKNYFNENEILRYDEEFWNIPNDTCLHGYFQAKEYVDRYQKKLRNELVFKDIYFDFAFNYRTKTKMNFEKIISVHIRRGDLLNDNHAFMAELSIDNYYNKIIRDFVGINDVLLFFSDDIEWCKQNFIGENYIFVDNRKKESSHLFDFSLMSMCDVSIMSVSTFSWWACWLNPINIEKKIIMPKKWWGWGLQNNDDNMFQYDNWIKYDNI